MTNDAREAGEAVPADPLPAGGTATASREQDGSGACGRDRSRQAAREPRRLHAVWLAVFIALAAAGAAVRLLTVPGAVTAVTGWVILTAALTSCYYLARSRSRAGSEDGGGAAGTWRPGDPDPAGIPAATMEAAARILTAARRGREMRLEIARCTGPVRHGMCQTACAAPVPGGIRVILGEHLAAHPGDAAFTLAHEVRHPSGWTCLLAVAATGARLSGWLIAGWAVPWPWLPAALAVIQAAHAAACWIIELACDAGAARSEGRDTALAALARRRSVQREQAPGPVRRAGRLLIFAAGVSPHPPLWLRAAVIRLLVPGPATA